MALEFLLKNHKIKIALMVIGVILLIYLAMGSWLSKIHLAEKKVNNAWGLLIENCNHRVEMIPQFIQIIQTYAPQAQELLEPLNKAYHGAKNYKVPDDVLSNPKEEQAFSGIQRSVFEALTKMEAKAASYPDLGQNRQYFMQKMLLVGVEEQIIFATALLNKEISNFNYFLSGFPQGWANSLFLNEKLKYPIFVYTIEKNPATSSQ